MYSYFQRDGLEKGWFADDFDILEKLSIYEGDVDGKEYVASAIQILKDIKNDSLFY